MEFLFQTKFKDLIERMPPGEEQNWWKKYLWYRVNRNQMWALAVFPVLLLPFPFPKKVFWSIIALLLSAQLVFFFLEYKRNKMWMKKFPDDV